MGTGRESRDTRKERRDFGDRVERRAFTEAMVVEREGREGDSIEGDSPGWDSPGWDSPAEKREDDDVEGDDVEDDDVEGDGILGWMNVGLLRYLR